MIRRVKCFRLPRVQTLFLSQIWSGFYYSSVYTYLEIIYFWYYLGSDKFTWIGSGLPDQRLFGFTIGISVDIILGSPFGYPFGFKLGISVCMVLVEPVGYPLRSSLKWRWDHLLGLHLEYCEISAFSTWFGLRNSGRLGIGYRKDSRTKDSGCSCNQRI